MERNTVLWILFGLYLLLSVCVWGASESIAFPPLPETGPILCPGKYLTPEQGKALLDQTLEQCKTKSYWEDRASRIRAQILTGAGLDPLPKRTPLNARIRNKKTFDGYTVENVAFESVPGYFVTGNLYRPLNAKPPHAVIVSPHGHARDSKDPDNFDKHGRFLPDVQVRCAALARMGAIVFSIDMFGWGENLNQIPFESHRTPMAQTMQIWNGMRAIDFLLGLEGADPKRVGATGASGGGTQTFLLAAVDDRVTVSVPVVMVSRWFFGGCPCESGRPIHRSAELFTNNVEIAAMAAPRPMLVVSDGGDWTAGVPEVEFPFIQKIYGFYNAQNNVANAHFPNEGHDYGPSKRNAMYAFMAEHLGLDIRAIENAAGAIDESWFVPVPSEKLRIFNDSYPLPGNALHSAEEIEARLKKLQL